MITAPINNSNNNYNYNNYTNNDESLVVVADPDRSDLQMRIGRERTQRKSTN